MLEAHRAVRAVPLFDHDRAHPQIARPYVPRRAGFAAGVSRIRDSDLPQPARFDLEGEELYMADSAFLTWAGGGALRGAIETHRV